MSAVISAVILTIVLLSVASGRFARGTVLSSIFLLCRALGNVSVWSLRSFNSDPPLIHPPA